MTLLRRTNRELDSMLNEFMGGDFFATPQGFYAGANSVPAVNISEDDNTFYIDVAAPGLKKKDFNIEFNNGTLSISASKKEEKQSENRKQTIKEFNYSNFSKSFAIAKHKVEVGKIEAHYENGILNVVLPKKEEAKLKPKRIIEIR